MRNISFSLTTQQFRDGTKDVTRRLGWRTVVAGERLMACEKCMGRKPGEPLVRLGAIEIVDVRREPLRAMLEDEAYGRLEVVREGFPGMSPREFVKFFCGSHTGCSIHTFVTRIQFKRV